MATFSSGNLNTSNWRQTHREIYSRFKKNYTWRQDETGGGGDCRSKQDTYKRINASRILCNVEQAEVKVSAVFGVVYQKQRIRV